jgi:serine/threonine-protein kinase
MSTRQASTERSGDVPYTLLRTLAAGSRALVCLARDDRHQREVVVRFPLGRSEKVAERFRCESQLLAQISHPRIVPMIDYFERAGRPFMVMEYVDGKTLSQALASGGPFAPFTAVRIIEQIASAVDRVHEIRSADGRELIHRDLKPAHVIIERCSGMPRLIDFGLASYRDDAGTAESTAHRGTLEYMSPEQATAFLGGQVEVDRRCDVWALGTILFELLTARRLFGTRPKRQDFASAGDWSKAIERYLSPRTSRDDARPEPYADSAIPQPLQQIIQRSIEKRAEARYQSAGELADALRRWSASIDGATVPNVSQ